MNCITTLGILLQVLLSTTHGSIELVCGVTSPDMPSSMTCQCKSTEGNGVEWRSNDTYTANCYFHITPSCSPVQHGYTFSSNKPELVFTMTLDPYIYSECRSFTCIDVVDTTKQQIKIPSAIEFDSTVPTDLTEPGANHTNGSISLTTNCISGYEHLITEWYIIYNGSEVRYTPDSESLITGEDSTSCTSCNSEAATSVTIGFTHTEAIGSSTQNVYFKIKVYHPSYQSKSLELTSRYVYAVKGDHLKDDDGSMCNCKIKIPLTLLITWATLFIIHHVAFKMPAKSFCWHSYFIPFAFGDFVCSTGCCKKGFWKKGLFALAVDVVFIILVPVQCIKNEQCWIGFYLIVAAVVFVIHIGIMIATPDKRLYCREKQIDVPATDEENEEMSEIDENSDGTVKDEQPQNSDVSFADEQHEKMSEKDENSDGTVKDEQPQNSDVSFADEQHEKMSEKDENYFNKMMNDLWEEIIVIESTQHSKFEIVKIFIEVKECINKYHTNTASVADVYQTLKECKEKLQSKAETQDYQKAFEKMLEIEALLLQISGLIDFRQHQSGRQSIRMQRKTIDPLILKAELLNI